MVRVVVKVVLALRDREVASDDGGATQWFLFKAIVHRKFSALFYVAS